MPRLAFLKMVLKRIALTIFGLQVVTIGALQVIALQRKRRSGPVNFPRTAPRVLATQEGRAEVFTYGEDLYDSMIEAIDNAEHTIRFETYIWKSDAVGKRFKKALIAAANRGVEVTIVWDTFANLVVDPRFFRFPDTVHARRHPLFLSTHRLPHLGDLAANHRKLMVVDRTQAWVGGYNIGSAYATDWRDTHVRLEGPVVLDLEDAFVDYWNMLAEDRGPLAAGDLSEDGLLPEPEGRTWHPHSRIARNVPLKSTYPIRNLYMEAIDRSSHRLWLTHAYFMPDADFIEALLRAAERGVDVRLILPDESNHIEADWLARGFYSQLLRGGVRLFLYQDAMVHSKTATADGEWATIGTANLDRVSLVGNYEINVEFFERTIAQQLEVIFANDLTNCRELTLQEWQSRGWMVKFSEALLRPFRPLL